MQSHNLKSIQSLTPGMMQTSLLTCVSPYSSRPLRPALGTSYRLLTESFRGQANPANYHSYGRPGDWTIMIKSAREAFSREGA